MFKKKKQKLTLRQVHEIYLLLYPSLPQKSNIYLIDEMDEIMNKITEERISRTLDAMKIDSKEKNGVQILTLFIRSLKEIDFFSYVEFLRGMKK